MSKQTDSLQLTKCIIARLWYTAATIVRHHSDTPDPSKAQREILRNLRDFIGRCALQGLHEHRWIAYNLLYQLDSHNEEAKRILTQEEFVSTLKLLDTRIPQHTKEELLRLFELVRAAEEKNDVPALQLSPESLECLESNLLDNPALIHWIIDGLLCIWLPARFAQSDLSLQDVYFGGLKKLLQFDEKAEKNQVSMRSGLERNEDRAARQRPRGVLLGILSKINLTDSKEDELLAWLFPALLKYCNNDDIELALYSRKNAKFFKSWHEFLDTTFVRCDPADSLENAIKVTRLLLDFNELDSSSSFNANEIFKRTLRRQQHWLIDIFEICYTLLINDRHKEVDEIRRNPLLKDFDHLLLFKLLSDCPSEPVYSRESGERSAAICSALSFLLKRSEEGGLLDPTLNRLRATLKNHVEVLNWILERKTSVSLVGTEKSASTIQNFSVNQTLRLLQSRSVLSVLKSTTNIHESNFEDVSALLKDRKGSRNAFQAYHAMLSALKAILLCDSYNSQHQRVAERFDDMEKSLGDLFPLELRLEVVENIFSMLFLRHEDFPEVDSGSDGGAEDSIEKSKSATKSEVGFLCNKYAARETLNRLRRSVTAMEIELAEGKKNADEANDNLRKGFELISKALADATWRLELLTSSDFIERRGTPENLENRPNFTSDSPIFSDDRLSYSNSTNKTIFYRPNESSSDESEIAKSDLDGSSEAGSQGNSTNNSNGRRRKKLRKNSSVAENASPLGSQSRKRERTLNCMLASKESLVLQCLWKSDYDRALQVIEMFDLRNSRLEGEILFSRAMKTFRRDMKTQFANSDAVDSPDVATKQSTLENIRRAVNDGFQSSRSTSQVETFLASQESSVRLLSSDTATTKEILALASLDLSLTISRTRQDSINLSGIAHKYLRSCKKLSSSLYSTFFEGLRESLHETSTRITNSSEISIAEILCDARIPLSVKKAKEKMDYWSRLSEKLRLFKKAENLQSDLSDGLIEFENSREKCFDDLISICENGELYLPRIHAHLKLLGTIVPQDLSEPPDAEFCLLKTPLDACIGDQIFRLNLEIDEVESIASRLGVGLVHSILVNCCPKLSCELEIPRKRSGKWASMVLNRIAEEKEEKEENEKEESEKKEEKEIENSEPNSCVTEILSELLEALRLSATDPRESLDFFEASNFSESQKIRRILWKTEKLARLDLSNLSSGNHTLAFFLNVWNLMFLHALLDAWSPSPPLDDLSNEISVTSLGYEIGDLGVVSLQALRSKLLGPSSWGVEHFSRTEELNEPAWQDLDVPFDARVVFAASNEFEDSPIIRIYTAKGLNEELEVSSRDYLNFYKGRIDADGILWLPELIDRYNSLNSKKSNSTDFNIGKNDSKVSYEPLKFSYKVRFAYGEEKAKKKTIFKQKVSIFKQEFGWQSRIVKPSLLQYLEGHCWLLSYLVQRIHEESPTILDGNCESIGRTAALENLLKSSWAENLKSISEDNETVAGLREIALSKELWNYFEGLLDAGETVKCLEVVNALPDSIVKNSVEIQRFKDVVLAELIRNSGENNVAQILSYVYQIRDEEIIARLVFSAANDFPDKVSRELLSHAISHVDQEKLPQHCKNRMREISRRVQVFRKMMPFCAQHRRGNNGGNDESCWQDLVQRTERANPARIVRSLIDANQFELCLEWLEYQAVNSEIHSLITQDLLAGLLNNEENDLKHAVKLLGALPKKKAMNLCSGVIGKLEAIAALRFVVGYLLENSPPNEAQRHRRALLGIDILEQLEIKERRIYAHLIERPLLMLEQMLMNCRLEGLQRILANIREKKMPPDQETSQRCFDETVRFYANKSLDFRVAAQAELEKIKDASLNSSKNQNGDFVMPPNIPTKDEWVPNDKARECSCCRVVIFTMFNRRHHCRRCGRVVCATCSPQRMRLPSYPNSVPVRVCNDCKRQLIQQQQAAQGAPSTPSSSEAFECWRLSVDEAHNRTLREEFSFENAPNISLCLAILNLHSDHEAYSNFLFDRCDDMKELLRPDSKGRVNPEVDHALIIKMMRSLLLAAKVKCAKLGLNTGLTHCDRFLSQVDLITTLINSDCTSLIPRTNMDDHLDDHTLRRLRDLLTEKEQWIVALDVSTKTGLDTQGVWAAWGTACLKAGYYERAREKFAHCLDKVIREDSDDWVMLSYPGESAGKRSRADSQNGSPDDSRRKLGNSKPQEGLKNRPGKDPPLLTEILQILDKMNPNDWYTQQNAKTRASSAHEIANTLSSLKSISQGQLNSVLQSSSGAKKFRYQESFYYLLMYGSFNSILEFFVRHREYDKCLAYILENDVEPELFMNVFLRCLRNGCMIELCEAMRAKDASLVAFRKYLMHTCHSLERKQLLNTLHQLQLFMKDYVRAAMTCIRFYVSDASSYEDLCSRTHFLAEAQRHLEAELQLEGFGRKRRKSVSSSISGQYSLTLEMDPAEIDRHINTISRQMEIAKFLGNRELEGQTVSEFMNKLSYMDSEGSSTRNVPTLFGNQQEKTHLAVLAILCGRDVEEGFGIAFRIMQDYNLRQQKIYSLVGHMLALDRRINSIEQLIKCCRSSGAPNSNAISDRVLAHCVKLLLDRSRTDSNPSPKDQIDSLIRIITDVELKIESYIESRQLKAAYLLAVKHSRAQDIRKILKEADRLGQLAIKSICTKWLQQTQGS